MTLKLVGPIDKGGFGNVELVEDSSGNRFARKSFSKNQPLTAELLENVKKRFAKEIRIQSAIQNRNIVPIFESDLTVDPPFYVMPLAKSSLAKDLAVDRQLSGNFTTALSDIVAGLTHIHAMQIYHRDLKPQNVLKFADANSGADFYAISDFGLISIKESQLSALTSTGMARGSDFYTAPEITKDLRFASVSSDVYSLGCILHDMIGTANRIPRAEIREVGPYAAVLLGCTRTDPKKRFKSAKAVLDAVISIGLAGTVPVTATAQDFIDILLAENPPPPETWSKLADFLDDANKDDRRAICLNLVEDRIEELCASAPQEANRIASAFANWVTGSAFDFSYCDGLANRIENFYNACDFEAKADCLMALLELGTSHNRWYVENKFVGLCGPGMDENLANRLAIEFRIDEEDICRKIAHLENSISFDRKKLHPALVKALAGIC